MIEAGPGRADAYRRIEGIRLPGAHWRTDIGLAAVEGRVSPG